MPTCKYCGNETGGSKFCQNCGAKVEEEQVAPQPIPVMQSSESQQPVQAPVPTTPSFYTPGGAGGLLAGNIILLILSALSCCVVFPLVSLALSIVGIVYASKVKHAQNAEQESSYRRVSLIMILVSIGVLILTIAYFIFYIYYQYGGFEGFWEKVESVIESAWDDAQSKRQIVSSFFLRFKR